MRRSPATPSTIHSQSRLDELPSSGVGVGTKGSLGSVPPVQTLDSHVPPPKQSPSVAQKAPGHMVLGVKLLGEYQTVQES